MASNPFQRYQRNLVGNPSAIAKARREQNDLVNSIAFPLADGYITNDQMEMIINPIAVGIQKVSIHDEHGQQVNKNISIHDEHGQQVNKNIMIKEG